jgi:NADH:ubiquinone oxidoreductase subunit 4 (subunit M)
MTTLAIAALFLPLFPASVVLNGALARLRGPLARGVLLLAWPHAGVALLQLAPQAVPQALVPWALATSGLYALRLLAVRDMGQWAGFLATSAFALTWALAAAGADAVALHEFAFWFSLPAALMALLVRPLTRRFGAAYAGLQGGLAGSLPRLSAVLVLTALAAVATPPFPGFFALLQLLRALDWSGAVAVLAVWLVWGWAAIRLLQGFVFGTGRAVAAGDIGHVPTLAWTGVLAGFLIAGLILTGGML